MGSPQSLPMNFQISREMFLIFSRGNGETLRTYHLILPKFHLILPKNFFFPPRKSKFPRELFGKFLGKNPNHRRCRRNKRVCSLCVAILVPCIPVIVMLSLRLQDLTRVNNKRVPTRSKYALVGTLLFILRTTTRWRSVGSSLSLLWF